MKARVVFTVAAVVLNLLGLLVLPDADPGMRKLLVLGALAGAGALAIALAMWRADQQLRRDLPEHFPPRRRLRPGPCRCVDAKRCGCAWVR